MGDPRVYVRCAGASQSRREPFVARGWITEFSYVRSACMEVTPRSFPVRNWVGTSVPAQVRQAAAEIAILCGATASVVATYLWTHPALYNPLVSIDPWLYTALWTNFGQIYHHLAGTYYVS